MEAVGLRLSVLTQLSFSKDPAFIFVCMGLITYFFDGRSLARPKLSFFPHRFPYE